MFLVICLSLTSAASVQRGQERMSAFVYICVVLCVRLCVHVCVCVCACVRVGAFTEMMTFVHHKLAHPEICITLTRNAGAQRGEE